ncbi:MAG: tRNA (adenosine(37)-N6)-threonylcarbamoyltransferase complex ATPase subunit type 1 TsaE [Phycisphaerales bacterium]|nr:tRNA (adenosine(37)-N6)-threonylcarbamoyltransferase complex ATPase subunit type 1 TsaE [Phycisphaerales bacterium]
MSETHAGNRVVVTHSPEETLQLGALLAADLPLGLVVAIDGPLGSGKTVLVRGMVSGLGGDDALVGSPTFGLAHEYPIGREARLVHVDCYRIGGESDLESIGWSGFAGAPDTITVVEWAGRIASSLPAECLWIRAGHCGETCREYEIAP